MYQLGIGVHVVAFVWTDWVWESSRICFDDVDDFGWFTRKRLSESLPHKHLLLLHVADK